MQIGIDVGGTSIKGGIVDASGVIVESLSIASNWAQGYHQVVSDLSNLIQSLSYKKKGVKEIGLGIPGIVSEDGQMVLSCPNLYWKNRPLKADLEKNLGLTVYLINDATAAALGEMRFGSGVGKKTMVMLTLGTGIGGGIVINNQIIRGVHGVASEIGHMLVGENFYDCSCGKNGCLETFSSVTALINYCQMRLEKESESDLQKYDLLDGAIIFKEAKNGDCLANEAVDRMCYYLGIGLSNINDLIDPDLFILGGGLSAAGTFLLDKVRAATQKCLTYPRLAKPQIVLASLGNQAGIIGASQLSKVYGDIDKK